MGDKISRAKCYIIKSQCIIVQIKIWRYIFSCVKNFYAIIVEKMSISKNGAEYIIRRIG